MRDNDKTELIPSSFVGKGYPRSGGLRSNGIYKNTYTFSHGEWMIPDSLGNINKISDASIISALNRFTLIDGVTSERTHYQELPLVSVITVVFNGGAYLEKAILSVINQGYPNIEYLIIDGGSTDDTLEIIDKYGDQIDYWISEKDDGIYDAMNKGLRLSNGEIIGLLNSDDWYETNAVEMVYRAFNADRDLRLVYGAMNIVNRDGSVESTYGSKENIKEIYATPFNHPTCFFHKKAYLEIGVFDLQFPTAADYDLMLRFKRSELKYRYLDIPLSNFRKVGVTSRSVLFPADQIWKVLRKNHYGWHSCFLAILVRAIRVSVVVSLNYPGGRKLKNKLRTYLSYHRKNESK